jgi:flagellar assembly factor FliW
MTPPAALAVAPAPAATLVTVRSDLLGPITVPEASLLDFTAGLFGFPECRSFVLVPAARDGVFWLQSADHSALAFLLVDPFMACDGYAVDLTAADLGELQATASADVAVLAIVTLPRDRSERPTANLQGPLALNLTDGRGKQLALNDKGYGVRYEFTLPG